jgi:hypothetical protein
MGTLPSRGPGPEDQPESVTSRADDRRIELTVQRVGQCLHGYARDHAGKIHEFTGWLGLLGVLETLLADQPTALPTEAP